MPTAPPRQGPRSLDSIDLAALADLLRAQLPGLRVEGPLARSLKCHVLAATLDDRPVVIKWLARPEPPWAWYFEREQRLLAAFTAARETDVVPELLAAGPRWMVLARRRGSALAPGRRAPDADATAVRAALRARRRFTGTTTPWPVLPVDDATDAELRARLLEDPRGGLAWCTDGLARGAALGLMDRDDAALAIDALRAWPALARAHGDLLPRNVLVDGDSAHLIDLECAGDHPEAWDHALLWASLPPGLRPLVEADLDLAAAPRRRAFWACVAFALVRELKFARGGRLAGALRSALNDVMSVLHGASQH